VATVEQAEERQLKMDHPFVRITYLKDKICNLIALVDTGSSVSFIKVNIFRNYLDSSRDILPVNISLNHFKESN